jgi:hypothetical protein
MNYGHDYWFRWAILIVASIILLKSMSIMPLAALTTAVVLACIATLTIYYVSK